MRYSEKFKAQVVRRMMGPNAASASALSKELRIPQPTLSKWLREAVRHTMALAVWRRGVPQTHAQTLQHGRVLDLSPPPGNGRRLPRNGAKLIDEQLAQLGLEVPFIVPAVRDGRIGFDAQPDVRRRITGRVGALLAEGSSSLAKAVEARDLDTVRRLVARGGTLEVRAHYDVALAGALPSAASAGPPGGGEEVQVCLEIMRVLLDAGASPNPKTSSRGGSLLRRAVGNRVREAVANKRR